MGMQVAELPSFSLSPCRVLYTASASTVSYLAPMFSIQDILLLHNVPQEIKALIVLIIHCCIKKNTKTPHLVA